MSGVDVISDHKLIARMLLESISSGLRGFVYDKSLVDDQAVRDVVSNTGIAGLLRRWEHGGIVVYYIDMRKLENICLYSECNESKVRRICLNKCIIGKLKEVTEKIISSIKEAYNI
ncbi:MAG: hypothetical protein F7C81_01600 [Desulfurococcales archaeon]|nr:hypothetical protein [Desulfurococcales archaeon]